MSVTIESKGVKITFGVDDERTQLRLLSNIPAVSTPEIMRRIYLFVNTITILGGRVTHNFFKNFKYVNHVRVHDYKLNSVQAALGIVSRENINSFSQRLRVVRLPIQLFDKRIEDNKIRCLAFKFVDKYTY